MFVLVYASQDTAYKRFKAKRYQLLKGFIDNYNVTINGKNFYDQATDSDIKDTKKFENWQPDKMKIMLLNVY